MYNARLNIKETTDGNLIIIDCSESDEVIVTRIITIVDGFGIKHVAEVNVAETSIVFETERDMAYQITLNATPQEETEDSVYETTETYAHTYYSEKYLLKLANSNYLGCNGCNDDWNITKRIFNLINNIDAAKRLACSCDLFRAQKLIDYLNEYYCQPEISKSCCHKEY